MVTDRVGDFIIRLQNAAMIGATSVSVPHSLHLEAIAKKLAELGYLRSVEKEGKAGEAKKRLIVTLALDERGHVRLRGVKRLSAPSRRSYVSFQSAHRVKGGAGARILSTPKGILSDAEARRERAGGETLFEIW